MPNEHLEAISTAYVSRWATEQLGDLEGHPFVTFQNGPPACIEFTIRFRLHGADSEADARQLASRIKPTVEPTEHDEHGVRLIEIGEARITDEPGDPVVEVGLSAQVAGRH